MAFERKLYPPIIESKLKSFSNNGEKGLVIPFRQNPSVSLSEIAGFACQIKTLGGTLIGVLKSFAVPTTMKGNQGEACFGWNNLTYAPAIDTGFNEETQLGNMDESSVILVAENDQIPEITWPTRIYHDDQGNWSADARDSLATSQYDYTVANGYDILSNGAVGYIEANSGDTLNGNRNIRAMSVNEFEGNIDNIVFTDNYAVIAKLEPNTFYKIQLAYLSKLKDANDDYRIGYYSDVAIIKYVNEPKVYLEGFSTEDINIISYMFTGVVTNLESTERLYSYRYVIETIEHDIECDSGELIYDGSEDDMSETGLTSKTHFSYLKDLPRSQRYFITYYITTTSGLQAQSAPYMLKTGYAIGLKFKTNTTRLLAEPLVESGCVRLSLTAQENPRVKYVGTFRILRTDEHSNFKEWTEIFTFALNAEYLTAVNGGPRFLFTDGTIEQGTTYQYALQQYNSWGIISNKLLSKRISVDYEDLYLSDADQILRICFNPNVSTFKPTILESKLETIGSKYPYIFRNGIVNYKEFVLTGLISYLMDQDHVFLPEEETIYKYVEKDPRTGTRSKDDTDISNKFDTDKESISLVLTDLTGLNIQYERNFKLKVLDWLTNGRPKLMRSPTEGNYIVRLTNVSLSPQATLGRMLHTFNCTAYEIDELNMVNLRKYNLIKTKRTSPRDEYEELEDTYTFPTGEAAKGVYGILDIGNCQMPSESELLGAMQDINGRLNGYANNLPQYLHKVRLRDFIPGSCIGLEFLSQETGELYKVPIIIGLGGSYNVVPKDFVMGIYPIWCPPRRIYHEPTEEAPAGYYYYERQPFAGSITYCYEDYFVDRTFDLIKSAVMSDQIIQGSGVPINNDDDTIYYFTQPSSTIDFFKFYQLQNLKYNLATVHALSINRREIVDCYLIEEHDLLPHYFNSATGQIELEKRNQLFLCRTAITPESDLDAFSPDGKIPFFTYEILDNVVYRCHYWPSSGGKETFYLDGWLLKLALEDYHRTISDWNMANYHSEGGTQTHLSVFDYAFVPDLTWLNPCMIPNFIEEGNTLLVTLKGTNMGEDINKSLNSITSDVSTYTDTTSSYHLKQIINKDSEGIELCATNYDTPAAFDCAIGPEVMIDAAITVAELDYDLSASGHAAEWQQILLWFNAIIKQAQTAFQNSTNEYERIYYDYQMRHCIDIFLLYLNWFIVEASIINQPLMIPPFPGLGELIELNTPYIQEHDQISPEEVSEMDDTIPILDDKYLLCQAGDINNSNLVPGVYYSGNNIIFMKPYSDKIALELTPEQLRAMSIAYGGSNSQLLAGLTNSEEINDNTDDIIGYYKITKNINSVEILNTNLKNTLKANNCVHLHKNSILCILNSSLLSGEVKRETEEEA